MFLAEVAENDDYHSRNQLRDGGIETHVFHKKFDEYIVQEQVDNHNHEVPE